MKQQKNLSFTLLHGPPLLDQVVARPFDVPLLPCLPVVYVMQQAIPRFLNPEAMDLFPFLTPQA